MAAKFLRLFLLMSLSVALSACTTYLGDRVSAVEQRLTEVEQNEQTQKVIIAARFDAINQELSKNQNPAPKDNKKAKGKDSTKQSPTPEKTALVVPRRIEPYPTSKASSSPAPTAALADANASAANTGLNPELKPQLNTEPAKINDPVLEALNSSKNQASTGSAPALPPASNKSASLTPSQATNKPMVEPMVNLVKTSPAKKAERAESSPAASGNSSYQTGLNLYEAGKVESAKQVFENFIAANPSNKLLPNAYYWLGECAYSTKKYDQAILTFKEVTNNYPQHAKASAAMLKMAYSYQRLGDKDNARFYLNALLEQYPSSEPAPLAKKQLTKL